MTTMTTTSPAIRVTGLRKSYGDTVVLDGLDLEVPEGIVFALLGPNGAGKTTTIQILTTLIRADGGSMTVAGNDPVGEPDRVRASIGVTGQFSAVDQLLTGAENLHLMADLHHLDGDRAARVDKLLETFDLVDAAHRPASTYSGGMRRRLDLAMSLVGRPQVLFLDEPTAGLDPVSRRAMWNVVRGLVRDGVTIFLTTQYLEEADQLADRIAVLDGGRLVAQGTAEELKRLASGGHVRLRFTDAVMFERAAASFPDATRDGDELALDVPSDGDISALRQLLATLEQDAIDVAGFSLHQPDLDDVFLTVTGHAAKGTPS